MADYNILYNGQWKNSVPEGVDLGMLSNYTQDILFSMERLSVNPFSIKRLRPEDRLPFVVDDETATNLTGATLERLHEKGFLFYADHRAQANLPRTARYAAACDAYFYIDPISGDFLPLAIRPNAGSDLIYTPLDEVNDWLLAKIMFNINDFWYTDWYHFAGTHEVVEIVYEAAIRTLSDDHPILAILNRSKYPILTLNGDIYLCSRIPSLRVPHRRRHAAHQHRRSNRYPLSISRHFCRPVYRGVVLFRRRRLPIQLFPNQPCIPRPDRLHVRPSPKILPLLRRRFRHPLAPHLFLYHICAILLPHRRPPTQRQ